MTLAARAGLPPIWFHNLRHGTATMLLGEPPKVIRKRLGHATVAFTMAVYTGVAEELDAVAAAAIAAYILRRHSASQLHIAGVGVAQSRNLGEAEQVVRDYIETLTDHDTAGDQVAITPEVGGGLDEETRAAREAVTAADQARRDAAARLRKAARALRQEAGLSGRDIAAILQVSAQRVSQLLKASGRTRVH